MEVEGRPIPRVTYSKRGFAAVFKANPEIWSEFKAACKMRSTSICAVLEALMLSWIEAQRVQATIIRPAHIEMHLHHVVEKPRRRKRVREPWVIARDQRWPPNCEHADEYLRGPHEVACREAKEWVGLEKCWRCYLERT